jgi:hypothetical protein
MNWTVCIDNQGYEASLEERKLYVTKADSRANALGMVRVIDESGSDYLYPAVHFSELAVDEVLEHRLLAA